jgi:hypothetical protein
MGSGVGGGGTVVSTLQYKRSRIQQSGFVSKAFEYADGIQSNHRTGVYCTIFVVECGDDCNSRLLGNST